ncbi:MAG: hypothetical protein WC774_02555 [Candidatus Gracilibacteria bacterium]
MSPSLLSHIDTLTETIGEKFEKSMDHILNSNIWIEKIDTTKDNLRISFIDAMSDLIGIRYQLPQEFQDIFNIHITGNSFRESIIIEDKQCFLADFSEMLYQSQNNPLFQRILEIIAQIAIHDTKEEQKI